MTHYRTEADRIPRAVAREAVVAGSECIRRAGFVRKWEWCGSWRRGRPTIGDLDLAAWVSVSSVAERLQLSEALTDRATSIFGKPAHVDVRYVSGPDARYIWPAMLLYLTGPRAWNVWCRARVIPHGWTLSEYGLFQRHTFDRGNMAACRASWATTERTLLIDSHLPPLSPRRRDAWSGWGTSARKGAAPETGRVRGQSGGGTPASASALAQASPRGPEAPPNSHVTGDPPIRAA